MQPVYKYDRNVIQVTANNMIDRQIEYKLQSVISRDQDQE